VRMMLSAILIVGLAALGFGAFGAPATPPPNLDNALASQQELAAQRPNDPQVLNDLGNLLVVVGRVDEAEEIYRRALELDPEMASAQYNLGLLLAQRGEQKLALQRFEQVLDVHPDNAWAHYQAGAIFEARHAKKKALRHYAEAFRLNPQLAFPEVNSHVIDNGYVTEALLLAYRNLPSTASAPKTYEEGSRIVSLMVAESAHQSEAAEGEAMEPEAEEMGGESLAPMAGEAEPDGSQDPGRVLREEDLEESSGLNQALPQGGATYYPPRGGVRTTPRSPTYRPPTTVQPQTLRSPGQANTRQIQPPNGRQRFIPGVPSTGKLEIELLNGPGGESDVEAG